MTKEITGANVPQAYKEALWAMRICGLRESSRNGPVLAIPSPVVLTIQRPWERVLFDPIRDANPFFHAMEFVWMMAGSNDAEWISQFNKRMVEYADDGVLRGAYGWRWTNPSDQITPLIELLKKEPSTRQAVLSMWDVLYDGPKARTSDRPCNTHIYFRQNRLGGLDMTVCNRSNDMIWGMLGANAVHMTMLHELVSLAAGMRQGAYRVFTNNLHVYTEMPKYREITNVQTLYDPYATDEVTHLPLLQKDETYVDFIADCKSMVDDGFMFDFRTEWMEYVGEPIHDAYLNKGMRDRNIELITATDWQRACKEWNTRRA